MKSPILSVVLVREIHMRPLQRREVNFIVLQSLNFPLTKPGISWNFKTLRLTHGEISILKLPKATVNAVLCMSTELCR